MLEMLSSARNWVNISYGWLDTALVAGFFQCFFVIISDFQQVQFINLFAKCWLGHKEEFSLNSGNNCNACRRQMGLGSIIFHMSIIKATVWKYMFWFMRWALNPQLAAFSTALNHGCYMSASERCSFHSPQTGPFYLWINKAYIFSIQRQILKEQKKMELMWLVIFFAKVDTFTAAFFYLAHPVWLFVIYCSELQFVWFRQNLFDW